MYINYLGVFPAYQNKKYGSAILQFIKQQHPDKILVLFSGSSNNFTINKEQKKYIYNNSIANAQAHFYKKNGFTEVALLEQNKNQSTMSFYYYDPAKEAQGIKK
jgi:GNAT superfamily N-acetyltransferase